LSQPDPLTDLAETEPETNYRFGRFQIDLTTRQLLRDGEVVPLTAKIFDTLAVLVKNHARIVGKDELMSAVWPDGGVRRQPYSEHLRDPARAWRRLHPTEVHRHNRSNRHFRFD
jgi:DNA-binding response OmpR family regulator